MKVFLIAFCLFSLFENIHLTTQRDFSGKVVLITGSSSGMGAVIAEEFARSGAQVVITGRNATKLAEVGKKCLKASTKGLKPLEVVADISKDEDSKRLIDTTIKKLGRLDVLVNNAGRGAVSSVTDPKIMKQFDEMFNLNVRPVIYLTHLSAKHLEKTKGNIVNIGAVAGIKPFAVFSIYGAAKSALDMFSKAAALELASKKIRVNVINPAAVETNFGPAIGLSDEQYKAMLAQRAKAYPLGRVGQPIDIANIVMFLASDDCSWVTGTDFLADGGSLYPPDSFSPPPRKRN